MLCVIIKTKLKPYMDLIIFFNLVYVQNKSVVSEWSFKEQPSQGKDKKAATDRFSFLEQKLI